MAHVLITIPSTDSAFRTFVYRTLGAHPVASPVDFERRLRRIYPRALVRERGLAGETPAWYVYRDGGWQAPDDVHWWEDAAVPRVEVSADGWIEQANATARGLLGIGDDAEPRHFTDFVAHGALDDAIALFDIVKATGALEATVVLQPATGGPIAIDVRVTATPDGSTTAFRLASDVDLPLGSPRDGKPARIEYVPSTDVAFRAYATRSLARMPEPTPEGLALRLRRLYPHAQVEADGTGWIARRDRDESAAVAAPWWSAPGLPLVRYDKQALILDANDAATSFFGRPLKGHHWQEFVTAGSTEEVGVMLEILAEAGAAESRFRMPRGDGTMLEFDSYTVAEGEEFSTVFRPAREPDPRG